jgi:PAS domain S-box-containing protein
MDRLLQDIIDILPVGAWVSDQHGELVHGNAAAERVWSGAGPPAAEDRARFDAWCRQACEGVASNERNALETLAPEDGRIGDAVTIECFDGSVKTILHSTAPLHDAQGRITGAVDIIQDITAFKANETRLQRREQLLLTMIDLLPVGVWATDKRGLVTLVNRAAMNGLGRSIRRLSPGGGRIPGSASASRTGRSCAPCDRERLRMAT